MKPLTFSILRLLSDGEFHSGVTLARNLDVSRTSISTALRGLEEIGVVVHRVHGRGYRLSDPVQWLDKNKILKYLVTEEENLHLEILDTTKSTNTVLLQKATMEKYPGRNKADTINVVATELQTNGRGRRGQLWHSGLGDSLTFSLLWSFQKGAGLLSGLSLAVGIAIIRSLKLSGIKNVALKWPNDVMSHHQKVAGILIELRGDSLGPTLAVIGVGINLKLSDRIKSNIDQKTTDLFSISGKSSDRNKLMARLLTELIIVLKEFAQYGFKPFRNEWAHYHELENKPVTLYLPDGSIQEGEIQGVTDNGSLILKTLAGVRYFSGGSIKLRKVT
jgi:BirA family biotin operon repressor/biotin-[acetyl-CoA-carboxylase] ligase